MTFDIFPLTLLMKSTLQIILTLAELFKTFPWDFFLFPSAFEFQLSDNILWLKTTKTFKITLGRKCFPDSYRSSGLPPFPPGF